MGPSSKGRKFLVWELYNDEYRRWVNNKIRFDCNPQQNHTHILYRNIFTLNLRNGSKWMFCVCIWLNIRRPKEVSIECCRNLNPNRLCLYHTTQGQKSVASVHPPHPPSRLLFFCINILTTVASAFELWPSVDERRAEELGEPRFSELSISRPIPVCLYVTHGGRIILRA